MTIKSSDWTGLVVANGRYRILHKLGEGGMGSVYRALDGNLDADVVIKVPRREMVENPEFAGRFTSEIRSLVKLSHPRIVKVTDVGAWEGLPFAVMQFLPGGSLEDRQKVGASGRPLLSHPGDLASWLDGIADALDYVHSQGYVHRDVKPGNILFDAQNHSFLSDFGVAKVLAATDGPRAAMTGAGFVLGTPEYMAPELITGKPFDGRIDQYALAVTVYEMLCGRRPFEDEVKTNLYVLHSTEPPPDPTAFRPALPGPLSAVVLKGMAKKPADRYPTCVAFAAAVAAAAAEGPHPQNDHVRIRCGACGQGLKLPASKFAKLKLSGQQVPCPKCNEPIAFSGPSAVGSSSSSQLPLSGTGPGGTMLLPTQGFSGSGLYVAPTAPPARAGRTVAEPVPGGLGGTPSASPPPQRANRTMIERANPDEYAVSEPLGAPAPPQRANRTVIERAHRTVIERATDLERIGTRTPPGATKNPRSALVWIGAGVALMLLIVAVGLMAWRFRPSSPLVVVKAPPDATNSRPEAPKPKALAPIPSPPPAPELARARNPKTESLPARVAETSKPATRLLLPDGAEEPRPLGPAAKLAGRTRPGPAAELKVEPQPPALREVEDPAPPWNEAPVKVGATLEQIVSNPAAFANQIIVPYGAFALAKAATRRADGSLCVAVVESQLDLLPDALGTIRVQHKPNGFRLDLDPKLAERLIDLEKLSAASRFRSEAQQEWGENLAILTVQVSSRRVCRLVKTEFFTDFDMQVVPVGFSKKLKMIYKTLTVTPEGEEIGLGKPDDWVPSRPHERLSHITNQYHLKYKSFVKNESQAKWEAFNAQVGSMVQQGLRDSARQQAQVQEQLRVLRGGR